MSDKVQRKMQNFKRALGNLQKFVEIESPDEAQIAGVIQAFEYTFELCWKLFQARAHDVGLSVASPKSAVSVAYTNRWIDDEALWLQMLKHRNDSVHTYNEKTAQEIYQAVRDSYVSAFTQVAEFIG